MIKFIADIGSNHNQDIDRAKKLIIAAKEAGCWGVKFQLFDPERLYAPGFGDVKELNKRQLPLSFVPELSIFCDDNDIKFGITPFYEEAVKQIEDYVDFLKISSFDVLRKDLIFKCLMTNKPFMISFGLVDRDDIEGLDKFIQSINPYTEITYFHCVSKYPTLPWECNMDKLEWIYDEYNVGVNVGWSDHTANAGVIHKAINIGAEIIEFHLDLDDEEGYEYEHSHCWTASRIKQVIADVKAGEESYHSKNNILHIENGKGFSQKADPSDGLRPMKEARK